MPRPLPLFTALFVSRVLLAYAFTLLGLPPSHVRFYGAVVAEALGYMHQRGIACRDLKPEHVMISNDGKQQK